MQCRTSDIICLYVSRQSIRERYEYSSAKLLQSVWRQSPGCSDSCAAFELVVSGSVFHCGASDVWSGSIVVGMPSSCLVPVLFVTERMQCGPNALGNRFEYESVVSWSAAVTAHGEWLT